MVTATFHSYLLHLTRLSVPHGADAAFWEQELPECALEMAAASDGPVFDLLVIDEAQDLLRNNYLDLFDLLVDGGLGNGRWRMFGDFEQQAVYGSSCLGIAEVLAERAPGRRDSSSQGTAGTRLGLHHSSNFSQLTNGGTPTS